MKNKLSKKVAWFEEHIATREELAWLATSIGMLFSGCIVYGFLALIL